LTNAPASALAARLVLYSGRDAAYTWFLLRGSGDPVRDYVLTLLVTAAVTYLLTPLIRRFARRIGAIKEPTRERDVHVAPVPLLGGLAMYGGLAAGLLVADQIPQLRGALANTGMISGLLLAGGLLVAVGMVDDRWGMSPLTKAAGQVAAGGIVVATGTQITWLPLPGGNTFFPTSDQATVLTILIVVATINAVNFIDGLDGLAAGIVAIAAISFFLYYYSMTRVIDISALAAPALASAILIGMCLGFLPHNFSPASIFMGDTGSMLLGLLLAYAPISGITSLDPALLGHSVNRYPEILPLLLPAALLVIPYADLLLAVVRRTKAGQSPFAPDRKHLHHRMLEIGHSQRASVLIMYLWAALFSGSVVWLSIQRTVQRGSSNHHGQPVLVFVGITAAAVVALLLLAMPKLRPRGHDVRLDAPAGDLTAVPVPEPAGLANAMAGLDASAAMELRPPAAAPVAVTGSAEPQLVAAGVVSPMTRLAAPVPPSGSPSVRAAAAPTEPEWGELSRPERGWPERDWPERGWVAADRMAPDRIAPDRIAPDRVAPAPDRVAPDRIGPEPAGGPEPGRVDPPAAAWTFGGVRSNDREMPDWRPADLVPADSRGRDRRERPHGYTASHRATAPADVPPVDARPVDAATVDAGPVDAVLGSRAGTRSIIGTPPPAVTGQQAIQMRGSDRSQLERRDAGQAES
jgi:UDP-GlcNAc:undecaprenyl-phosphate/decaprenyl-phosphate GlcNAc-1-phosphate transferase